MLETLKFIILLAYSSFAMIALAYMLISTIKTNREYKKTMKKARSDSELIIKQIEESNKAYRESIKAMCKPKKKFKIEK